MQVVRNNMECVLNSNNQTLLSKLYLRLKQREQNIKTINESFNELFVEDDFSLDGKPEPVKETTIKSKRRKRWSSIFLDWLNPIYLGHEKITDVLIKKGYKFGEDNKKDDEIALIILSEVGFIESKLEELKSLTKKEREKRKEDFLNLSIKMLLLREEIQNRKTKTDLYDIINRPEESIIEKEQMEEILKAIKDKLAFEEFKIVCLKFGFLDGEAHTNKEIAKILYRGKDTIAKRLQKSCAYLNSKFKNLEF